MMQHQHLHQLQQHRGIKSKVEVDYQVMKMPLVDQYTGDPKNYIQLLLALKHAPNVSRLQQLVDNHSAQFDAPHVSAALTRLPKVARFRQDELIQRAISATSTRIPSFDPAAAYKRGGLIRMLPVPGAQARRAYREAAAPLVVQLLQMILGQESLPPGAHLNASKKARRGLIKNFTERNAANCVWALGTLHRNGVQISTRIKLMAVDRLLSVFAGRQGKQLPAEAKDASSRSLDIAQLVCGLSKLQVQPRKTWGQELLQTLAMQSAYNAQHFTARDVQMALHGFKSLGFAPRRFMDAMAERIVQLPRDFAPQGIATIMGLLAPPFRAYNAPHIAQLLLPPGSGAAAAASPLPAALHGSRLEALQCLAEGVAPQIVALTPHDLATMAGALAGIGAAYRRSAGSTNSSNLANSSSGGGSRSRSSHAEVAEGIPDWVATLGRLLSGKAVNQLGELQALHLAQVLDMVGALGMRDEALLETVANGILAEHQLSPTLPVPAAVSLIHTFASMGLLEGAGEQQQGSSSSHSIFGGSVDSHTPLKLGLLPSAPRVRGDGLDAPESTHLHALQGTPLRVRATAAVDRVLSVYTAPRAIQSMGGGHVASLISALAVLHRTCGVPSAALAPLLNPLMEHAEALLLPPQSHAELGSGDSERGGGRRGTGAQQDSGSSSSGSIENGTAADEQQQQQQLESVERKAADRASKAGEGVEEEQEGEEEGDGEEEGKSKGPVPRFTGPQLLHMLRSLNTLGACSMQVALAAVQSARDMMLAEDPSSLPAVVEIACEACAGGAPADEHTAGVLSESYVNAMAGAHSVVSTENGLATPHVLQRAGDLDGDEGAGAPNLGIPQLGQLLWYVDHAGCMSDVLLEAAAEQLLQQLPSAPWNDGPDDSSSGSDRTWMLAVSEKNEAAAAAVARALAQCINVFGPDQSVLDSQQGKGRRAAALQAVQQALLRPGLLPTLSTPDLEAIMDSASPSEQAGELSAACRKLLKQRA